MWLSLSWTKVNGFVEGRRAGDATAASRPIELAIPPLKANSAPVPAHAMHFRNSRRPPASSMIIEDPFRGAFDAVTCPRGLLFPAAY